MAVLDLIDVVEVGALKGGERAYFYRGEEKGGSEKTIVLRHGHLGKLITYLFQVGALAERERGARQAGSEFTMTMLNEMGVAVHAMTDGSGRVGMEVALDQGV